MPEDIHSLLERVATEAPEPLDFVDPVSAPKQHARRHRSQAEPSVRTRVGVVLLALAVAGAGTFFAIRAFDGVGKHSPASPAPIPQRIPTSFTPGRIAYDSSNGIFTINPDGSGVQQISSSPGANQPAWSPDGQLLAFADDTPAPGAQIFVMNADGSDVRALTTPDTVGYGGIEGNPGGSQDYLPLWSPDGTQVAFLREAGGLQIGLVNADGSGQRILTSNNSDLLAWTPDGLLEIADPVSGVELLDPTTGKTSAFPTAGEMGCPTDSYADGVTFSADGSVAVCWSYEPKDGPWTLSVMYLANHSVRTYELDVGKAGFAVDVWRPAIAPDGSAVAFESFHGNDDLFRLDLTGPSRGKVSAITDTPENEGWAVWAVASPGSTIRVPNVVGLSRSQALKVLEGAGLAVGRTPTIESSSPNGTVVSQYLRAGARVSPGTRINLWISTPVPGNVLGPLGCPSGEQSATFSYPQTPLAQQPASPVEAVRLNFSGVLPTDVVRVTGVGEAGYELEVIRGTAVIARMTLSSGNPWFLRGFAKCSSSGIGLPT